MRTPLLTLGLAAVLGACAQNTEPPPIAPGRAPHAGEYDSHFDAQHYDLQLTIPDSGPEIQGRTEIQIRVQQGAPDVVRLDFTGMRVKEVRVNGQRTSFAYATGKLAIPVPPDTARQGGNLRVLVVYDGTPDDGLAIQNNIQGARAVFADNWPNRARFWFPSLDHPSDKATASFTIETPRACELVANGVPTGSLFQRSPLGGTRVHGWKVTEPISPYNMVIGAGEFQVRTLGRSCPNQFRCVEISTWLFPESAPKAARSFARAVAMVDYFTNLIGPFPYRKLAHIQSSTRFGGMENATAIFYPEKPLAEGQNIEDTVAHETAHQWFGDSVTEAEWHHLWLSEGFATYFAAMFFEHADGGEPFRRIMEDARERLVRSQITDRPIIDPQETDLFKLLNPNNYEKGSWVLHMLRGIVGDTKFRQGVRTYYEAHEHGTATTRDFRLAMQAVSGERLDWFFDQWIYKPGFPKFRSASRWDPERRAITVTIEQTQSPNWPTFRVPVVLEISTGSGVTRHNVTLANRLERFVLRADSQPTRVVLDPDGWVLKTVGEESSVERSSD
jgi:aminopeptidase N